jgi:oligoribonuclease NrnB/cAMP/cGMP phosphodiesterase (DHH superfamily)
VFFFLFDKQQEKSNLGNYEKSLPTVKMISQKQLTNETTRKIKKKSPSRKAKKKKTTPFVGEAL